MYTLYAVLQLVLSSRSILTNLFAIFAASKILSADFVSVFPSVNRTVVHEHSLVFEVIAA